MILKLLDFKESVKQLYEKYGLYVKMVIKLITAFIVFSIINTEMGYNKTINNLVIVAGLSIISALTPDAVFIIFAMFFTVANAYSISPVLAFVIVAVYMVIYFMYIRFAPKQVYAVMAVPVLYALNIPYAVPLICGIFMGPVSIISNVIGILLYFMFREIINAAMVSDGSSVSNTVNFFNIVVDNVKNNTYMVASMIIFAAVILVTYIIRRQKIKHAANIAILIASMINVVSFLVVSAFVKDADTTFSILTGSIAGMVIAYIASFFRMSLDYSGTKHIQFEDDEYYYYVKAVPKLSVSAPDKQIKTIHAQSPTGNTANISEAFNVDYNMSKKD